MASVEKTQNLLTTKQVASSVRKEIKRIRKESEKIQIHDDVMEEIMVRLPVKSLMRFQTVSKHWRSLIRSKFFRERHMALEQTKECKLLCVCNYESEGRELILFKTMAMETTSASLADEVAFKIEGVIEGDLGISESCDGLVCFYKSTTRVKVLNPATGTCISLPLSRMQRLCMQYYYDKDMELEPVHQDLFPFLLFCHFGFGKDSINGRYKLVWLYNYTSTTTCEVLDLEEKKWRLVSTTTLGHQNITWQRPVFANGSFYWLMGDKRGFPTTESKLIVFDIHTEVFQVIPTPPFITRDISSCRIGLCNLHGRLCISEMKGFSKQEFWWRIKDNTWERIFSVDFHWMHTWFRDHFPQLLTPLAICKDTNKVILSIRDRDNLVAFDLDPHSPVYHLFLWLLWLSCSLFSKFKFCRKREPFVC